MHISLSVDVSGRFGRWAAGVEVPELYLQTFQPVRTSDDAFVAYAAGEVLEASVAHTVALKAREDAAEILAKELTKMIIDAMSAEDTHNGYATRSHNHD